VLAALTQFQKVVDLAHRVKFDFLWLSNELEVIFSFRRNQWGVLTWQYSGIRSNELLYYGLFTNSLTYNL
jgi:hypothetical protein